MNNPKYSFFLLLLIFLSSFVINPTGAQMITGVWKGRINGQKVELKIIQNGDSLTGTSYYYESADNYRRYSIKGYFDPNTNAAVWWDDQLIEKKSGRLNLSSPGKIALLSRADFNCPGGSKMMLDGKAVKKENDSETKGEVHLDKVSNREFEDEWDFVIDNYTTGTNDPDIIDSIASITKRSIVKEQPVITIPEEKPVQKTESSINVIEPVRPPTIEEKFISRKKILTTEIPVTGDSIELRFYDNAEIDGDSISLFLNDKLIFQHIRLTGNAYIIKLSVRELNETNELIMVAENLGSIPPNTAYMVALVDDKRYDARLESTEGSSLIVRFVKK